MCLCVSANPMLLPFPLYYHGTLSECTDSAVPRQPIAELFVRFSFLCQQFVVWWADRAHWRNITGLRREGRDRGCRGWQQG